MLEFSGINYGAVLVAILVSMVIGGFWYSPFGFGKLWSKETGIDMMKLPKKQANLGILSAAVTAVLQAVFLAVLLRSLHVTTVVNGLEVGLLLVVGFVAASTMSDTIYAKRGYKVWAINSKFYLVALLINSAILAAWR